MEEGSVSYPGGLDTLPGNKIFGGGLLETMIFNLLFKPKIICNGRNFRQGGRAWESQEKGKIITG